MGLPGFVVTAADSILRRLHGESAKPGIRKSTGVINEDLFQVSQRSRIGGFDCITGSGR